MKFAFLFLLVASFSLAVPAAASSNSVASSSNAVASVADGDTLGGGGKGG